MYKSKSNYVFLADGSKKYNSAKQIINDYVDIVRFSTTRTQRDVFYTLRDKYALADSNGALAYVIGNVNGTPFNNIYQNNGVRYFRNDNAVVYQVQWNQDVATGKVITIFFTKI